LNYLFSENTTLAGQLLTVHNIAYMMQLVRGMRQAIVEHRYREFVVDFLKVQFPMGSGVSGGSGGSGGSGKKVPNWVVEALLAVNIDLSQVVELELEAKQTRVGTEVGEGVEGSGAPGAPGNRKGKRKEEGNVEEATASKRSKTAESAGGGGTGSTGSTSSGRRDCGGGDSPW
jgi:hypothetical protein